MSALTSTGSDILFLSDIRISDRTCLLKVQQSFNSNPNKSYQFIANSTKNSRGTAILVSYKLEFTILEEYRDEEENILGLLCSIRGIEILVVSIYGPNNADDLFYEELRRIVLPHANKPIIMGGTGTVFLTKIN